VRRLLLVIALSSVAAGLSAPASSALGLAPFGHQCQAQPDGIRFCPTTDAGPGQTVDGVPLDVDVTLPPSGRPGPYPTIVMLHGYGAKRPTSSRPTRTATAPSPTTTNWN
jgi:hypothetical protein